MAFGDDTVRRLCADSSYKHFSVNVWTLFEDAYPSSLLHCTVLLFMDVLPHTTQHTHTFGCCATYKVNVLKKAMVPVYFEQIV